jgi:hypothetical protein
LSHASIDADFTSFALALDFVAALEEGFAAFVSFFTFLGLLVLLALVFTISS